jgi:hypothetical protein
MTVSATAAFIDKPEKSSKTRQAERIGQLR